MIYKFTSIKPIIAKVYRDLDLKSDEAWLNMIEWAAEALDLIGACPQYSKVIIDIPIKNYKGAIPCNFIALHGASVNGVNMYKLQGLYDTVSCKDKESDIEDVAAMRRDRTDHSLGYTFNDGYFNVNFEEGTITVSCTVVNTDSEGFPQVPDDVSYREAIYRYILTKLYYPDFISGKINPQIYTDMRNEWYHYSRQAKAKAIMPDLPTMENIVSEWMQLIPQIGRQNNKFKQLGLPEDSRYNNL